MPVNKNKQAKCTVSDRKIRTVYLGKIQNILRAFQIKILYDKSESNIFHTSATSSVDLMVKSP